MKRLEIQLPNNWFQEKNPDGPATFCRNGSTSAFQVSWAEYRGGKPPDVTTDRLKEMAVSLGQKQGFGEMLDSSFGDCKFGKFGTAVFRSTEWPRVQIWFISDGRDHIMVTHLCDREPEMSEIAEAQQTANNLSLGPEQP